MTDRPMLPAVVPGRSALPAFLALEAWAEARLIEARAEAEERLAAARAAATALEQTGRERLRQAVLVGEAEALRDVESRAVDRVSLARRQVEAWVGSCEAELEQIVASALDALTRPPERVARAAGAAVAAAETD